MTPLKAKIFTLPYTMDPYKDNLIAEEKWNQSKDRNIYQHDFYGYDEPEKFHKVRRNSGLYTVQIDVSEPIARISRNSDGRFIIGGDESQRPDYVRFDHNVNDIIDSKDVVIPLRHAAPSSERTRNYFHPPREHSPGNQVHHRRGRSPPSGHRQQPSRLSRVSEYSEDSIQDSYHDSMGTEQLTPAPAVLSPTRKPEGFLNRSYMTSSPDHQATGDNSEMFRVSDISSVLQSADRSRSLQQSSSSAYPSTSDRSRGTQPSLSSTMPSSSFDRSHDHSFPEVRIPEGPLHPMHRTSPKLNLSQLHENQERLPRSMASPSESYGSTNALQGAPPSAKRYDNNQMISDRKFPGSAVGFPSRSSPFYTPDERGSRILTQGTPRGITTPSALTKGQVPRSQVPKDRDPRSQVPRDGRDPRRQQRERDMESSGSQVARVSPSPQSPRTANDSNSSGGSSGRPVTYTRDRLQGVVDKVRKGPRARRRSATRLSSVELDSVSGDEGHLSPSSSRAITPPASRYLETEGVAPGYRPHSGYYPPSPSQMFEENVAPYKNLPVKSRASVTSSSGRGSGSRGSKNGLILALPPLHTQAMGATDSASHSSGIGSRRASQSAGSGSGAGGASSHSLAPVNVSTSSSATQDLSMDSSPFSDSSHGHLGGGVHRRDASGDENYEFDSFNALESELIDALRHYKKHPQADREFLSALEPQPPSSGTRAKPKKEAKGVKPDGAKEERCQKLREEYLQYRQQQKQDGDHSAVLDDGEEELVSEVL